MLTAKEEALLVKGAAFCTRLKLMAYAWEGGELTGVEGVKVRWTVFLFSAAQVWNFVFLVGRTRVQWRHGDFKLILNLIPIIVWVVAAGVRITLHYRGNDFMQLFNHILRMNTRGKSWVGEPSSRPGREKLVLVFVYVIPAAALCLLLQTLLSNAEAFTWRGSLLAYACLLLAIYTNVCSDCFMLFLTCLASVFTLKFWIAKASVVWPKKGGSGAEVCEKCTGVYRSMVLLANLHNDVYGSLFIPILKLMTVLTIFAVSYCLMKLRGWLGPGLSLIFGVYLLALFLVVVPGALLMSAVFNASSQFHINMGKHVLVRQPSAERNCARREVRALPVLKCKVGDFYYMEENAKLTLADNILRGIACVLLSF